jgi:UDP-glucose 4-epimerase
VAENELTGVYNLGAGESYDFNTVEYINKELGTDVELVYIENPIPVDVYIYDK